jgi:hypothetical protein
LAGNAEDRQNFVGVLRCFTAGATPAIGLGLLIITYELEFRNAKPLPAMMAIIPAQDYLISPGTGARNYRLLLVDKSESTRTWSSTFHGMGFQRVNSDLNPGLTPQDGMDGLYAFTVNMPSQARFNLTFSVETDREDLVDAIIKFVRWRASDGYTIFYEWAIPEGQDEASTFYGALNGFATDPSCMYFIEVTVPETTTHDIRLVAPVLCISRATNGVGMGSEQAEEMKTMTVSTPGEGANFDLPSQLEDAQAWLVDKTGQVSLVLEPTSTHVPTDHEKLASLEKIVRNLTIQIPPTPSVMSWDEDADGKLSSPTPSKVSKGSRPPLSRVSARDKQ